MWEEKSDRQKAGSLRPERRPAAYAPRPPPKFGRLLELQQTWRLPKVTHCAPLDPRCGRQGSMALVRAKAITSVTLTIAAVLAMAASGSAHTKTRPIVFKPFNLDGSAAVHVHDGSGYCWTGSLATPRRDAWRCFEGNTILDPCFSSVDIAGAVVCPNIGMINGVELNLTKPLPHHEANRARPSLRLQPWNIELTSSRYCRFATGGTEVVARQRLNYGCNGRGGAALWGYPSRHSQPWTILFAPYIATSLGRRASIRRAWM